MVRRRRVESHAGDFLDLGVQMELGAIVSSDCLEGGRLTLEQLYVPLVW